MLSTFQDSDFVGPGDLEMLHRILADYCQERGIERNDASHHAAKLIHHFQDGIRTEGALREMLKMRAVSSTAA